jgi:hypothetical protein
MEKINDLILKERKFLHDISNQLVVAQGMGHMVLKNLKGVENLTEKELVRMEKTVKAVENIVSMVKEQRNLLHKIDCVGVV